MKNEMLNAVVLVPTKEAEREWFRSQAPDYRFTFVNPTPLAEGWDPTQLSSATICAELPEELTGQVDVVVGTPSPDRLHVCPNLKLLQTSSAGVNRYCGPGILPPGARLAGAGGAYGPAVSEHMLAMLLALFKKLPLYRDSQNHCSWQDAGSVRSIEGSEVLVVGLGDIGSAFARKVHALGARVTAVKRTPTLPDECREFVASVHPLSALESLLPHADVVALVLPDTAETRGMFDRALLARMKEGACLLNAGRGTAIVTSDLLDAVRSGRLLGVGLDVTDPEPLPADHPLWQEPRVLITPHVSGLYHLRQTYDRVIRICAENLRRFASGKPLRNEMDPATGNRK